MPGRSSAFVRNASISGSLSSFRILFCQCQGHAQLIARENKLKKHHTIAADCGDMKRTLSRVSSSMFLSSKCVTCWDCDECRSALRHLSTFGPSTTSSAEHWCTVNVHRDPPVTWWQSANPCGALAVVLWSCGCSRRRVRVRVCAHVHVIQHRVSRLREVNRPHLSLV